MAELIFRTVAVGLL